MTFCSESTSIVVTCYYVTMCR